VASGHAFLPSPAQNNASSSKNLTNWLLGRADCPSCSGICAGDAAKPSDIYVEHFCRDARNKNVRNHCRLFVPKADKSIKISNINILNKKHHALCSLA